MDTEEQRQYIHKTLQIYKQKYWLFQQQIATLGTQRNPSIDLEIQSIEKEIEKLNALLIEVPTDLAAQQDIREKLIELSQTLSNEVTRLYSVDSELIKRTDDIISVNLEVWQTFNALLMLIEKLYKADTQIEYMAQYDNAAIRVEVLMILMVALMVQLYYNSIRITLLVITVIWALVIIAHLLIFSVFLPRYHAKTLAGKLNESQEHVTEASPPTNPFE
jgi:hypothetical protein